MPSKPMVERKRGEKSKAVRISISSYEQHGFRTRAFALQGSRYPAVTFADPEWASGNGDMGSASACVKSAQDPAKSLAPQGNSALLRTPQKGIVKRPAGRWQP